MGSPLSIHLIGICGTGMGSLAGLLKAAGHTVRGSDHNVYPPMSDKLEAWQIPVSQGYRPENLIPKPDLVVMGNVLKRTNPEAQAALAQNLRYASFPETLADLFLTQRRPLVVTGTHGKTTTTSLLAWLLTYAGQDPSMLVGGVPENFGEGFRLGSGPAFVLEGDEYDTAFFDKRPKFLHYRPHLAIMTSLEFDHADIYPDVESIETRFDELARLVPKDGRILACASSELVLKRQQHAKAHWDTYTAQAGVSANWQATQITSTPNGTEFELLNQQKSLGTLMLPMSGQHNVENAVAAIAAAIYEGISFQAIKEGLARFKGVARRQTVVAEVRDIRIIDDFAHHPTAVEKTLAGLKARYPEGRLIAVFEPRSATSARRHFQDAYAQAFTHADLACIAPVGRAELDAHEKLDTQQLAQQISDNHTPAKAFETLDALLNHLVQTAQPKDTLVFMSNGGFGDIHQKIRVAL